MMKQLRIAVTGPESSGKTTLAEQLAKKLNGTFIPEFSREYLLALNRPYNQEDLDLIALGQMNLWKQHENDSVLVCDTEMLVMHIWSEVSYQNTSDTILKLLYEQQFDHYFLCAPDIPWEADPLREHPEMREALFEMYHQKLKEIKLPFTVLNGEMEERIRKALEFRDNFLFP